MWSILNIKKRARVYLDYAGAMPVLKEAREAFIAALQYEGNPGALHREAQDAMNILSDARKGIAAELGCKAREVIFTSGGTEGNNLAILGLFKKIALGGKDLKETHWIVSAIEHPSVLECFEHIQQMGGSVTILKPDAQGRISVAALQTALQKDTVCVSIGWANGEIGVIQSISALSQVIRSYEEAEGAKILFHSDLGQAPLYHSPQVHTLGVDIATLDGGKLGAVRGIGALYIKTGTEVSAMLYGGGQEAGLRPGTENVALAAGFSNALEQVAKVRSTESARLDELRQRLIKNIEADPVLAGAVINGSSKHSLSHIINISIPNIDNEYITLGLDRVGFALATKSACKEGEKASHVILALTGSEDAGRASNALRISMGLQTRKDDIDRFCATLARLVGEYRVQKGK